MTDCKINSQEEGRISNTQRRTKLHSDILEPALVNNQSTAATWETICTLSLRQFHCNFMQAICVLSCEITAQKFSNWTWSHPLSAKKTSIQITVVWWCPKTFIWGLSWIWKLSIEKAAHSSQTVERPYYKQVENEELLSLEMQNLKVKWKLVIWSTWRLASWMKSLTLRVVAGSPEKIWLTFSNAKLTAGKKVWIHLTMSASVAQ